MTRSLILVRHLKEPRQTQNAQNQGKTYYNSFQNFLHPLDIGD